MRSAVPERICQRRCWVPARECAVLLCGLTRANFCLRGDLCLGTSSCILQMVLRRLGCSCSAWVGFDGFGAIECVLLWFWRLFCRLVCFLLSFDPGLSEMCKFTGGIVLFFKEDEFSVLFLVRELLRSCSELVCVAAFLPACLAGGPLAPPRRCIISRTGIWRARESN